MEAMDGLIAIASRVGRLKWEWFNFGYRRTDRARNMMAYHLLHHSKADYLCMLDSDHEHSPNVIERLVGCTMADPRIKIVGGMNYRRGPGFEPMAYRFVDDYRMDPIKTPDEPVLMEVDAISTASILIHRKVLQAMKPPWFFYNYEYFDRDVPGGGTSSEDIEFCRRVKRETDFGIWVHTGIVSPHLRTTTVGDASWREQYLREQTGERE